MNFLKSELRYSTPFRNSKATNEDWSFDFAHFSPKMCWLPWKRFLSDRKKWVRSVICDQIPIIW